MGVLYWDRIKNYNMLNTDPNFEYAGVNPCSEEPLPAGGSCLLGSLNLSEFVVNPFTDSVRVDYDKLEEAVVIAVQGLNEVLLEGMALHPLEVQRKSVCNWRQIGLGTFGLGDLLIKLGVRYGSKESIDIVNSIFKFIATTAIETSLQLAKVESCYPACNKEALIESSFIKALNLPCNMLKEIKKYGLYNSQLLTCAPTGTTATMLGVSTGVEPNFSFHYTRRTLSLNNEETLYTVDVDIVSLYKKIWGDCRDEDLPDFFISSQQIPWKERIDVQAALQTWIDASISSTCNLPEETTIDDVFNLYMYAWKKGLKGITVWRNNCNRQGILSTDKKEETSSNEDKSDKLKRGDIIPINDHWLGLKRTLSTGCGSLHVNSYWDPDSGELRECFLSKGSTGGCQLYMIGLSRMISLAARGGISIDNILDQLGSCGVCPSYAVRQATLKDTSKGSCCPVAVGNAIRDMHNEIQDIICKCKKETVTKEDLEIKKSLVKASDLKQEEIKNLEECPSCHEKTLIHTNGCLSCPSCGWSRCS